MAVLGQGTRAGNFAGISREKPTRRSAKRKMEPKIADGDRIVIIVVSELKALGYPIELVNFVDDAGNLTAALVLTGKTWSEKSTLERQKKS